MQKKGMQMSNMKAQEFVNAYFYRNSPISLLEFFEQAMAQEYNRGIEDAAKVVDDLQFGNKSNERIRNLKVELKR